MCELEAHWDIEQDELPNFEETLPGERRTPRPEPAIAMMDKPVVENAVLVVAATICGR